jgi:hypothetical protein
MALLAETVVEEWLHRRGFFTIRGIRQGHGEMDLLAVHPHLAGRVTGWHVEVTVSFRPIGYLGALAAADAGPAGGTRRSVVRKRTPYEVEQGARAWVERKFGAPAKARLREQLWPAIPWEFHLVHGLLRYPEELDHVIALGVAVHPFHEVLRELTQGEAGAFSGSAGSDLADIVAYCTALASGAPSVSPRSARNR